MCRISFEDRIATAGEFSGSRVSEVESRSRVLLVGEWETSNLGDRAILRGASEWLRTASLEPVPVFFGALRMVSGSPKPPSLLSTRTRNALEDWLRRTPRLFPMARDLRARRNLARLVPLAEEAAAIMVGGGALLDGRGGHFIPSLAALARLTQRTGTPMVCLGCGRSSRDPPSGREARVLRDFLSSCQFVAVRDPTTSALLAPLAGRDLPVFGDFAFTARQTSGRRAVAAVLGINVMQVDHDLRRRYEASLVHAAEAAEGFEEVVFFTTGERNDVSAAKRVMGMVRRTTPPRLVPPDSDAELRALITRCSVVIASRLHAAIIAFDEGARVIDANPYEKVASFFGALSHEPIVTLSRDPGNSPISVGTGSRPDPVRVAAIGDVRKRARAMLRAFGTERRHRSRVANPPGTAEG